MRLLTFMTIMSHKNFLDHVLGRNLFLKRKGVIGRICQLLNMAVAKEEEREFQTSPSSFYFIILHFSIAVTASFSILNGAVFTYVARNFLIVKVCN